MKLGIFDTGRGGEIVAERLERYFPDAQITVINDREHLPYGDRTSDEIYELTKRAITPLINTVDIIVIACNTATAAAIDQLRLDFPNQKFVGYEPMVKPAAQLTQSGRVIILATRATLASSRYQKLVAEFGRDIEIATPDTTHWARDIEAGKAVNISLDETKTAVANGADVIVLACTHYLALEDDLKRLFPSAQILEPTAAVAARITVVSQLQR